MGVRHPDDACAKALKAKWKPPQVVRIWTRKKVPAGVQIRYRLYNGDGTHQVRVSIITLEGIILADTGAQVQIRR